MTLTNWFDIKITRKKIFQHNIKFLQTVGCNFTWKSFETQICYSSLLNSRFNFGKFFFGLISLALLFIIALDFTLKMTYIWGLEERESENFKSTTSSSAFWLQLVKISELHICCFSVVQTFFCHFNPMRKSWFGGPKSQTSTYKETR